MSKKKPKKKNRTNLVELGNDARATFLKAREAWSMFSVMSEFIQCAERLADVTPAVTIFGSKRQEKDSPLYKQCKNLAKSLSDEGFSVMSGGGPGIMEAANRGAFAGASPAIGLNIDIPGKQKSNRWQDISLSFRNFFSRKVALLRYSCAFVVFPGGYGTFDELTEILTLVQTGKFPPRPIILVDRQFWKGLIDWISSEAMKRGLITEGEDTLLTLADTNKEILEAIRAFYPDGNYTASEPGPDKMLYL